MKSTNRDKQVEDVESSSHYRTWSSWTWRRRRKEKNIKSPGQQQQQVQVGASTLPRSQKGSTPSPSTSLSLLVTSSSSSTLRNRVGMAGTLMSDATAGLWHAFNFLDDQKNGQVPKSKLKVLTANLGTVLDCPNVENGLQDHRSTSTLSFDDYIYYLRKELFSVVGTSSLSSTSLAPSPAPAPSSNHRDRHQRNLSLVEEVCWLVCRSRYLKRDVDIPTSFPDQCVFQLFRIFCMLVELDITGNCGAVMSSNEVEHVVRHFVIALGKHWDQKDFQQISEVVSTFKFSVFLALLENSYAKDVEVQGLEEATQEIFDMFIGDVLKKSFLSKKGHLFSTWRVNWYVLRPTSLAYFNDQTEREKRGELIIDGKCNVESLSDAGSGSKGNNRFLLICGDKSFELSATDHKTKLQWITALQTAIDHDGHRESHQRLLASRRRGDREQEACKDHDDRSSLISQRDLLERHRIELEAEKIARLAAETEAREQQALREQEVERLREVEAARKELERLLEEEKQAKRDEEIVRNLQARLLREEWEKREELERLQEEQKTLLTEERNRRENLEERQLMKELALEAAGQKLKQLEDEKCRLDKNLNDARNKIVVAERAKEILEAKLRVRDKSLIPLPISRLTKDGHQSPQTIITNTDGKSP